MSTMLSRHVEVSPRRWMFLPIGVKVREFDGSAALAFEAAERGWGVILANKNVIKNRTDLPKGMQIEKKIANGTAAKIPEVWATGRKVAAWCEEGLVYSSAEEYGWRKVEKKAYELLEMYFAWGQNQFDDMNTLGCNGGKLVITGNPRFDLHRPDFRAIFDEKAERLRKRFAPFILINTKFSLHNGLRTSNAIVTKMRDQEKVQTPEQEEELKGGVAFHRAGYVAFMELVEVLSRSFPSHTVVVRPHPSEKPDPWVEKAATLPNVQAIREGNVAEWILAADACVHNNCTTGVESYLLGKPAISYRPVSDPRYDLYLPNALSVNAFDIDSTVALVATCLRGESISTGEDAAKKAELAARYIANVTGKLSSERIMDALDSLDLPVEPLSFSTGPIDDLKIAASRGLSRLKSALGVGSGPKMPARHSLTKSELVELLDATRKVTGRYGAVQVAALEDNVLCIH